MADIYSNIAYAKKINKKGLAILLDPDKIIWESLPDMMAKINRSPATHIFIGGSQVLSENIDRLVLETKKRTTLPVVLFPGNPSQISDHADGILFLSLLSGRNADFLIGHQVAAAPRLANSTLEVISTGYMLIESGTRTAVEKVSATKPLRRNDIDQIVATAQAGALLGKKMIYLEAGSGANQPVPAAIIKKVSENISIPLIVGGGIRTSKGIDDAYNSGADIVVIGTAFENDNSFFDTILGNLEFESEK